jgi:hypothetical protein
MAQTIRTDRYAVGVMLAVVAGLMVLLAWLFGYFPAW